MSEIRKEIYSKLYPLLDDLADIACDNIETLVKTNGWISVEEALPDTDEDVLITYKSKDEEDDSRYVAISCYREENFGSIHLGIKNWQFPFDYFRSNYIVTAWMLLPQPYEEDK